MKWDSTRMFARSTDVDRTYASAENLLQTLFPEVDHFPKHPKVLFILFLFLFFLFDDNFELTRLLFIML